MILPVFSYRCNKNHFDGKSYFEAGKIYRYTAAPNAMFDAVEDDPLEFNQARTHVDGDGTIYFAGNAFNYDDWKFPLTRSLKRRNDKPDFDFDNNGYLFPQNDDTEVLCMSDVTSHMVMIKAGMLWFPHIHFIQSQEALPIFEYQYKFQAAGADTPSWSGWIATDGEIVFAYESGDIHQILKWPAIDAYAAGVINVATIVDVQVRRNDDVVTGDVLTKQFDYHVPLDSPLGSGQEYIK